VVQSCLEDCKNTVRGGPPRASIVGFFALCTKSWLVAAARTNARRRRNDSVEPAFQSVSRQLWHWQRAQFGNDVRLGGTLHFIDRFATAAIICSEIVGDRVGYRNWLAIRRNTPSYFTRSIAKKVRAFSYPWSNEKTVKLSAAGRELRSRGARVDLCIVYASSHEHRFPICTYGKNTEWTQLDVDGRSQIQIEKIQTFQ
jgi:hypothetical protein